MLVSSEEEGAFPADTGRAQFRANGLGNGGCGDADGAEMGSIRASPSPLSWSGWEWRLKLEERHCSGGIPTRRHRGQRTVTDGPAVLTNHTKCARHSDDRVDTWVGSSNIKRVTMHVFPSMNTTDYLHPRDTLHSDIDYMDKVIHAMY